MLHFITRKVEHLLAWLYNQDDKAAAKAKAIAARKAVKAKAKAVRRAKKLVFLVHVSPNQYIVPVSSYLEVGEENITQVWSNKK